MDPVAIAAVIVVLCACAIGVAGRLLKRDDTALFVILMLLTMLPALFLPRFWRDVLLCGGVFVLLWVLGTGFWDKLGWAAGVSVPLYLLSIVVPGGASVITMALTLLGLWFSLSANWRHRERLKRATELDPAERENPGEVEIGGKVERAEPLEKRLPELDFGESAAGYRLRVKGETFREPEHLRLSTPKGHVLIALESIELEGARIVFVKDEQAKALRTTLALPESTVSPTFQVLDVDKEVYVIGTPTFVRSTTGASYRDQPMLPMFGKGSKLYVASETEIERETAWNLWLAGSFATSALVVGIVNVLEPLLKSAT